MKYFLIAISIVLISCSKSEQNQTAKTKNSNTKSEQEIFVSNFYKKYLSNSEEFRNFVLAHKEIFFTKETTDLFLINNQLCDHFRRWGICKLEEDVDPLILSNGGASYSTLRFKLISKNVLDIYYTTDDAINAQTPYLRLSLKQEKEGWRVDDIIPYEKNTLEINQSLITILKLQNNNIPKDYMDIKEVVESAKMLFENYTIEFAKKVFSNKLEVCEKGTCNSFESSSPNLSASIEIIKQKKSIFFKDSDLPKIENPTEHQKVELNGFTFEFIDQLWYITKIDLDKLQ